MTTREEIALLPCPFCGGAAEIREATSCHDTWLVRCTSCQIKTVTSYTKDEPISEWNKRALSPLGEPTSKMVEDGASAIVDNIISRDIRPENIEAAKLAIAGAVLAAALGIVPARVRASVAGWQDISTAKKDGRRIGLLIDGKEYIGRWEDDRYAQKPRPYWQRETFGRLQISDQRKQQPTMWRELHAAPHSMVAEERIACPRCGVKLEVRPVFLGMEGHICGECWQQDRFAEDASLPSQERGK